MSRKMHKNNSFSSSSVILHFEVNIDSSKFITLLYLYNGTMKNVRRPTDTKAYEDYYLHQVGQGIPTFEGPNLQRGYGLGGIVSGLLRSAVPLFRRAAIPLIKRGVRSLGKHALKTSVNIAQDALAGQNVKLAAKRRLKETGRTIGQQALKKAM